MSSNLLHDFSIVKSISLQKKNRIYTIYGCRIAPSLTKLILSEFNKLLR